MYSYLGSLRSCGTWTPTTMTTGTTTKFLRFLNLKLGKLGLLSCYSSLSSKGESSVTGTCTCHSWWYVLGLRVGWQMLALHVVPQSASILVSWAMLTQERHRCFGSWLIRLEVLFLLLDLTNIPKVKSEELQLIWDSSPPSWSYWMAQLPESVSLIVQAMLHWSELWWELRRLWIG